MTNNYTHNMVIKGRTDKIIDRDPFNDREFTKDFKSIRKMGGLSVRE